MYRFPAGGILAVALIAITAIQPALAQRVTLTLKVDGIDRTALVDPGKDAATTPAPVLFAFHGHYGCFRIAA